MNFEEAQLSKKDLIERRYGSEITQHCQVLFSHGLDCRKPAGMVINALLHNLVLVTAFRLDTNKEERHGGSGSRCGGQEPLSRWLVKSVAVAAR